MKISKLIALLESELEENGDNEIMIYDHSGDFIEPKSFDYGEMYTDEGRINTVTLSDWNKPVPRTP